MISFFFKIALAIVLLLIAFQDFKERRVWWFLFPVFAILGGWLFYKEVVPRFYLLSAGINIGIVTIIIGINYLYATIIMKKQLQQVLGLGDILFFLGFALSFPTLSFINFFLFSVLFTLVVFLFFKYRIKNKSVAIPLAGSMAVFLILVYCLNWMGVYKSIYML